MKLIKKVVGIDISKDSFTVCFGTLNCELKQKISKPFKFDNNVKGFKKLLSTMCKVDYFADSQSESSLPTTAVWFVMQATGVYYENLAYFLSEANHSLSVVIPNKIKNFAKTLENKSKTDNLDAATITSFGLEKQLNAWKAPYKIMKQLKELSRERLSLIKMINQVKNKMHAKNHSHKPGKETLKRLNKHLSLLKSQLKDINLEIKNLYNLIKNYIRRLRK